MAARIWAREGVFLLAVERDIRRMRRALALTLALCCLLSSVALATPTGVERASSRAVTPVTPVAPTTNTTAYLSIPTDELESTGYRRPTLDVSGSLSLDTTALQGRFTQLTLDERFATTDADTARRAQLRTSAARIEGRIERLRERQVAVIDAYNNGSLPPQEFLRDLALIDAAAGRLGTAADRVAARARSVPLSTIDGQPAVNWARNRRLELGALEGPVRDRIREALRGENVVPVEGTSPAALEKIGQTGRDRLESLWVYVETSRNGVVLAAVDDDQYYREAFLPGERNATGRGLDNSTNVFNRVGQLYPWASNNSGSTELRGDPRAGIYEYGLFHGHGQLTTYLDRDSGRVFAEKQRKSLMGVPTAPPVTASSGNLRVRVNRTHPTGPLELSVTTAGGEPVDGRITVANRSIGRTGTDGRLWTITPRGTVTIVVRANGRTVRLETSASPPSNRATHDVVLP